MKTLEQVKAAMLDGTIESCFPDGRNIGRLVDYFPLSEWEAFGFAPVDGADVSGLPKEFTEQAIKQRLAEDLDFAFEKALNQRGISSSAMYSVIKTWLFVLDCELASMDEYSMYGLPLYKAVALKFGLPNPIGDDSGAESKYDA